MHFDITAANDEFLQIHRHDQILLDFGAALKPHLLLSNWGNNRLNGNILGQHWLLTTPMDKQQARLSTPNFPLESVP